MRSGLSTDTTEPVKISIAGAPAASDLFRARRRHPPVFNSKAKRRCPVAVGDNAKWRPRVGGAGRYSPECRLSEIWQCGVARTAPCWRISEPGWALICLDEQCGLPALLSCVCVKFSKLAGVDALPLARRGFAACFEAATPDTRSPGLSPKRSSGCRSGGTFQGFVQGRSIRAGKALSLDFIHPAHARRSGHQLLACRR